jgi:hypothetical protein
MRSNRTVYRPIQFRSSPSTRLQKPKAYLRRMENQISIAASALARLPRKRKRPWTGWVHGKHLHRDDLVVVPDGQVRRIYGAVRGSVIVLKYPIPERGLPAEIFRAEDLRLYKNPNAVIIGSLKRGRKEVPSEKKRKACRLNGCKPPRPGSRPRGRPRKNPTSLAA